MDLQPQLQQVRSSMTCKKNHHQFVNTTTKLVVHVCGYNFFLQNPETVKLCTQVFNTTTYLAIQVCQQQQTSSSRLLILIKY